MDPAHVVQWSLDQLRSTRHGRALIYTAAGHSHAGRDIEVATSIKPGVLRRKILSILHRAATRDAAVDAVNRTTSRGASAVSLLRRHSM
jgi:hypothetical protein